MKHYGDFVTDIQIDETYERPLYQCKRDSFLSPEQSTSTLTLTATLNPLWLLMQSAFPSFL